MAVMAFTVRRDRSPPKVAHWNSVSEVFEGDRPPTAHANRSDAWTAERTSPAGTTLKRGSISAASLRDDWTCDYVPAGTTFERTSISGYAPGDDFRTHFDLREDHVACGRLSNAPIRDYHCWDDF